MNRLGAAGVGMSLAFVLAVACGDDEDLAPPSATHAASPGPAQQTATPDATEPIPSELELARDEHGSWQGKTAMIDGTSKLVVQYVPDSDEDETPGRLGLLDLDSGQYDELHTLEPQDQAGAVATDGSYLAWVEVRVFGTGPLNWRLFAVELGGGEPVELAAGDGNVAGLPPAGPPLEVADGQLYFARYMTAPSGDRTELVAHDLASGAETILASGESLGDGRIVDIAASDDSVYWLVRPTQAAGGGSMVRQLDFATGVESAVDTRADLLDIAFDGATLVGAAPTSVLIRHSGGFETLATTAGMPDHLGIANGIAWWLERDTRLPVFVELPGGAPVPFESEPTTSVYGDGQLLVWIVAPELAQGGPVEHRFVRWLSVGSLAGEE